MSAPFFFHFIHTGPIAASVCEITQIRQNPCKRCHRLRARFRGPIEVAISGKGVWPDILPMLYRTLFSERYVDAITRLGVAFTSEPVTIRKLSQGLRGPRRAYHLVEIPGGLDLDLESGRCRGITVCPACGCILSGGLDCDRHVPVEESWNGSCVVTLRRPLMSDYYVCTRELLEVARAEAWVGFSFTALDVPRRLLKAAGYHGINYLAKRWPPESWYPKRPSEGRSPRAWLEMYNSERDGGKWYEAWAALLDLGDEVLPLVMEQFRSIDEIQRVRAARLLEAMSHQGVADIPMSVVEDARAMLPQELWPHEATSSSRPQRSAPAWLARYLWAEDWKTWWQAWSALRDVGDEVVPLACAHLDSTDKVARARAARLLVSVDHGGHATVPRRLLEQAHGVLRAGGHAHDD